MSDERERVIYAYEDWPELVVHRCPNCGSTGRAGSACVAHDASPAAGGGRLVIQREPVVVPMPQEDD